jgi:sec-independent protein translocase protein TatA
VFSQVGPLEIILVLAIALIVLGPKRLPGAARSVGRGLREFKESLTEADPRVLDDDEEPKPQERAPTG